LDAQPCFERSRLQKKSASGARFKDRLASGNNVIEDIMLKMLAMKYETRPEIIRGVQDISPQTEIAG
jgi:hypothetical protein